jgi:hypothetical protein
MILRIDQIPRGARLKIARADSALHGAAPADKEPAALIRRLITRMRQHVSNHGLRKRDSHTNNLTFSLSLNATRH